MSECCRGAKIQAGSADPCAPPRVGCRPAGAPAFAALARFERMIPNCIEYAQRERAAGRPIVGIMCEYTPRELIMAGGGVPVCLCGGAASTIATAEEELPANLCPLIKSTYGYELGRSNPFMEMADLVVAETTCDGKKKMFELMGERRAMHILELPQKWADPDAMAHWRRELIKLREALEARWGVSIGDDKLRGAIATMNRERRLRRELAELMARDIPPLTGSQLLMLKSSISGIPEDFEQYEAALAELSARQPAGKRRPRVLLTGVPIPHGAERVVEIIEEAGAAIVAMENCTGIKPIMDDVDEALAATDPLGAIAEKYFHLPCSVMTRNDARLDLIKALAQKFRADCVIDLTWHACLTYDVESSRVRRMVERDLNLPYLQIQTDYSPADSARIAVRVEALLEMV
ncbi:MAG: double-cubane-cluster-containing anaerobic reductase [Candidatus Sumerlaeia bacterium]